jgi:hypothetical protein
MKYDNDDRVVADRGGFRVTTKQLQPLMVWPVPWGGWGVFFSGKNPSDLWPSDALPGSLTDNVERAIEWALS